MASVLHKTADPVDYRRSVNTPDYPPVTWFINPDVSVVVGVDKKYWARPLTDPVTEMDQAAKDAVDAAESTAATQGNRDEATGVVDAESGPGVTTRALIELLNKRDNYLINRVIELQGALDAIKNSSGPADNIRNAVPANWLATNTRTKPEAVTEYKNDINAGNQDA